MGKLKSRQAAMPAPPPAPIAPPPITRVIEPTKQVGATAAARKTALQRSVLAGEDEKTTGKPTILGLI